MFDADAYLRTILAHSVWEWSFVAPMVKGVFPQAKHVVASSVTTRTKKADEDDFDRKWDETKAVNITHEELVYVFYPLHTNHYSNHDFRILLAGMNLEHEGAFVHLCSVYMRGEQKWYWNDGQGWSLG